MSTHTRKTVRSPRRRVRLVFAVVFALLLHAASTASAATPSLGSTDLSSLFLAAVPGDVYVATFANGGNDTTGDGSQAAPFATMAAAMTTITAGHTIHVGPGEFACEAIRVKDGVSIRGAGSSATTLTANAKGRVLIYDRIVAGEALSDVTITGGAGNAYGGGIYLLNSSPAITDCVIAGNSTTGKGGGIYSQGGSPSLIGCTISSNTATAPVSPTDKTIGNGGGIWSQSASAPSLINCIIASNKASRDGGAIYASTNSQLSIASCEVVSNSSGEWGGAIYLEDSGTVATITASAITSNVATYGGGAVCSLAGVVLDIRSCEFVSNSAGADGGAVFALNGPRFSISTSRLVSNSSANRGGAVCLEGTGTVASITASTIASNSAANWGGGFAARLSSEATVTNSIVWGNASGSGSQAGASGGAVLAATYSDIGGGYPGIGNIDADPGFRDAAAGDYRLSGGSPAIDTATSTVSPATDLLGEVRPQGTGVDMGAYEYVFRQRVARDDTIDASEDVPVALNVLTNDDPSESTVHARTAVQFSQVSTGTLVTSPSGDVTYTPPADWSGEATCTYVADYETTQSAPATVKITVSPVNDAPKAISDGELAMLQRMGPPSGDVGYGGGVAIQGDTAIVNNYSSGIAQNGICVYQRSGGIWRLRQTLPSGSAFSAALDGDTYAVGVFESSCVNVYVRNADGIWALQQTIQGPDDKFGFNIGLSGDTIVVGDIHTNVWWKVDSRWANPPGSAFVYTRTGTQWTRRAELHAPLESSYGDWFGLVVGVDRDTIMVGSRGRGAWVFTRTGADWSTYDWTKLPLGSVGMGSYGKGIDIDDDTAIIGTNGGPFILNRTSAGWVPTQRLDPHGNSHFSVALDGDVGVATDAWFGGYIIRRTPNGWVRSGDIPPIPDGISFGENCDISDGTILMGDRAILIPGDPRIASYFIDGVLYGVGEDASLSIDAARGVLHNDTDVDSDRAAFKASLLDTSELHGTLDLAENGSFTYTPTANFSGKAKATYRVTDAGGASSTATITITVDPVNDAPVASDVTRMMAEDATSRFNLFADGAVVDIDTPHASLVATAFSTLPTGLQIAPSGEATYTPPTDFNGDVSFTYRVSDGTTLSAAATVTIKVTPVEDAVPVTPPVAADDGPYATAEDAPLAVPAAVGVLGNDTDAENEALTPSLVDTSKLHGTLAFTPNGGFIYTPEKDYFGPASATYRDFDGTAYSAPATITFNVTPVNDAPVAVDDEVYAIQNGSEAFNVLANDFDIDSPKSSLRAVSFTQPSIGTFLTSPTGDVTFYPPAGFLGTASFTYRVTDGEATSSLATVRITVSRAVITRIGGVDRFDAAANIARRGWDSLGTKEWTGVKDVIIANGEVGKEADPLCAAGLAGVYDAPILLVQSRRVPATTRRALTEIAAKNPGVRIHIVGGTGSVPERRWDDIKRIAGVSPICDRISGSDRYEVSAGIAKRMVAVKGAISIPAVLLVAGDDPNAFYDGLAAAPIAYARTMPLLAVRKNGLPPQVAALLKGALAQKKRYAVSSSTYIGKISAKGAVRLVTSKDRYTAASQIANSALGRGWLSDREVGVTAKLPDALTGGAFLGRRGGVLLFTDGDDSMQPVTQSFLTSHEGRIRFGWILGGTGSVSAVQEDTFRTVLKTLGN